MKTNEIIFKKDGTFKYIEDKDEDSSNAEESLKRLKKPTIIKNSDDEDE